MDTYLLGIRKAHAKIMTIGQGDCCNCDRQTDMQIKFETLDLKLRTPSLGQLTARHRISAKL